ncbi:hypothetical protein [Sulfurimonas sp. CS5]|jgi:hypothetical protein|uniref:hypothetical protein n=1 Tax=Sulfurimonas sp. CS5 TaxID=3391145 RepID=UPI0039E94D53
MKDAEIKIRSLGYTFTSTECVDMDDTKKELYISMNKIFDVSVELLANYSKLHPLNHSDKVVCNRLSNSLIKRVNDIKLKFLYGSVHITSSIINTFSFFITKELLELFDEYDSKFHKSFSYSELFEHHAQHTFWHVQMMIDQIFHPEVYMELTEKYFKSAA